MYKIYRQNLYLKSKRAIDFTLALFFLLILFPILIIIAVLVKQKLGSPVLFKQMRPGLNGKPFQMIKFRTMMDLVGEDGLPLSDAERTNSYGIFLRSFSLDELPELWNVFMGDMSLIGPRPLLMEYLPLYSKTQARRHEVRPGLTGWAQVNGRNAISWEEKFAFDVWYVDNNSIWLDIKIFVLTIKHVLLRKGISAAGEATMPKFRNINL